MNMAVVNVKITRIREGFDDLELPSYQTSGSVGVDLRAAVETEVTIQSGKYKLVPSGIAIALPSGFEAQVRPRSGLAVKHGLTVLNAPGTIDSDYRGEIKIALINHSEKDFVIKRGERIAQLIIAPISRAVWHEVETLDQTDRGSGGFGHTGR